MTTARRVVVRTSDADKLDSEWPSGLSRESGPSCVTADVSSGALKAGQSFVNCGTAGSLWARAPASSFTPLGKWANQLSSIYALNHQLVRTRKAFALMVGSEGQ